MSRFYDPEIGRFISSDDVGYIDIKGVDGLNLYCYCGNDPINYADPSGHFVITTTAILTALGIGAAIGAGIGFGAAYIPDVIENLKQMDFNGVI